MYFKCVLEDGTEIYKQIDQSLVSNFVNPVEINDLVYSKTGVEIHDNDWTFTDVSENYNNIVDVDLKEVLDLDAICSFLNEEQHDKKIQEVSFLEAGSYEHVVASLSLECPKDIYKKRIIFTEVEKHFDYDYEDYDPYSDGDELL